MRSGKGRGGEERAGPPREIQNVPILFSTHEVLAAWDEEQDLPCMLMDDGCKLIIFWIMPLGRPAGQKNRPILLSFKD